MSDPVREPSAVLNESIGLLALVATRCLYAEQPKLWDLGERGRARTLEDFTHHLKALAALDETAFRDHVAYCERLFSDRGFPRQWLTTHGAPSPACSTTSSRRRSTNRRSPCWRR